MSDNAIDESDDTHPIDIKDRLLNDGPWHDYDDMCEEAAAEIERLQGERDEARELARDIFREASSHPSTNATMIAKYPWLEETE